MESEVLVFLGDRKTTKVFILPVISKQVDLLSHIGFVSESKEISYKLIQYVNQDTISSFLCF